MNFLVNFDIFCLIHFSYINLFISLFSFIIIFNKMLYKIEANESVSGRTTYGTSISTQFTPMNSHII